MNIVIEAEVKVIKQAEAAQQQQEWKCRITLFTCCSVLVSALSIASRTAAVCTATSAESTTDAPEYECADL